MTTRNMMIASLLGAAIAVSQTADTAAAQVVHHNPKTRALQKMSRIGARMHKARALVNRKVAPGRVAWHASIADARARALVSGKPVLVFQLLGKLDDEFC